MVGRSSFKRQRLGGSNNWENRPQIPPSSDPYTEPTLEARPAPGSWNSSDASPTSMVLPALVPGVPPVEEGDGTLQLTDMGDSTGSGSGSSLTKLFSTHGAVSADILGDCTDPLDMCHLDIVDTPCSVGVFNPQHAQDSTAEGWLAPFARQDQATHPPLTELGAKSMVAASHYWHDSTSLKRYPHAAALTGVIESLERCSLSTTSTMDQIMSVNRKAMTSLPPIMAMDGFKLCHSCPTLVPTSLDLILSMYESALDSMQSDPADNVQAIEHWNDGSIGSQSRGSPSGPALSPPDLMMADAWTSSSSNTSSLMRQGRPIFYFGCLELEPDEQVMLRDVVLKRDLLKCLETIRSCHGEWKRQQQAQLTQAAPCENHQPPGRKRQSLANRKHLEEWYQEMQEKARELLASVKPQGLWNQDMCS
ncbi:Fc.00g073470.m01.CDS01 [Cosmosporella sp. VM-42]